MPRPYGEIVATPDEEKPFRAILRRGDKMLLDRPVRSIAHGEIVLETLLFLLFDNQTRARQKARRSGVRLRRTTATA